MKLARFNIIVAIDKNGGIARGGQIPWYSQADMKFFKDTTTGNKRNAVIMGRKTYETIDQEYRPLRDRHCAIVSRTWKQVDHTDISVYPSVIAALEGLGASSENFDEIFVAGGEEIYNEIIKDYLYLCKKIYVTVFKENHECDQFFPWAKVRNFPQVQDKSITGDYTRFIFGPNIYHEENNYLSLLEKIRDNGELRPDRTGVGTLSLFSEKLEFNISERIPVLTTKKMFFEKALMELLFFISGSSDTKILEAKQVDFWKDNTSSDFIKSRGLDYQPGDMGPMYGFQWRHWGAEYRGCHLDYNGEGIDQLKDLIDQIKLDPFSRRHILNTWNVSDLDKMVLSPCHNQVQFYVTGNKELDCQLYMRSADIFLGVPYNIVCYSLLTYMIAHLCNLKPRRLILTFGDVHIYKNHIEQVNKQLKRTPKPFPTLFIKGATNVKTIDEFTSDNFILEGYNSWSVIAAKMAV